MVFGQLNELLEFSDRVSESLEIMERYRGKQIRIQKHMAVPPEEHGSTQDNHRTPVFYEGTVTEVVTQPTGFLMENVLKYTDDAEEDEHETVAEKFVSFNDIDEIDILHNENEDAEDADNDEDEDAE